MRKPVKQAFLYLSRSVGLFALARLWTRRSLRILCFHGGSVLDEYLFRPGLFMREETIRQRLETLARLRYPVLDLASALQALAANRLPACGTVITIDDGFYSTFTQAGKLLQEFHFPATIYVTTYYAVKQNPIFRLVVSYMFWKTRLTSLDGTGLPLDRPGPYVLTDQAQKDRVCWEIIDYAERKLDENGREELASELGKRLGVDYQAIVASRAFHIMTEHEIRTLAETGIDIQLHTHRHRHLAAPEEVDREVPDNRTYLADWVKRPLQQLCYPSGVWSEELWPALARLGIVSATTCDPGLNDADTHPLGLRRFLDAEDISRIEFEAELSGFADLLRRIRSRLAGLMRSRPASMKRTPSESQNVPAKTGLPFSGADS